MENFADNSNPISDKNPEESYKYNFITIPWDDRTKKSKFWIVFLIVSIFVATMACVLNSMILHYRNYGPQKVMNDVNCHVVRMEDFPFVARIHSMATQGLLCVGAIVSPNSVLASEVCSKSGPMRLRVGNALDPQCKKEFTVDTIETIDHDGVVSKKLALLSTKGYIEQCGQVLELGIKLDQNSPAFIIGRPLRGGKLSRQPVRIAGKGNCTSVKDLNGMSTICVINSNQCPVRVGDMLVQNDKLFGLASTSVHRMDEKKLLYFADLSIVHNRLLELDIDIASN